MDNKYTVINNSIDVCGHTINIVKDGFDIEEVTALIKRLTGEISELEKRQENLTSLTRLYEKTVIEAGELAKQIERETRERVQKEAGTILSQAHQRSKVMIEQQQAEARQLIHQRLGNIRNSVQEHIESVHKQEIDKLRSIIKEMAKGVFDKIMAEEVNLGDQGKPPVESLLDEKMFELFPDGELLKDNDKLEAGLDIKEDRNISSTPGANTVNFTQPKENNISNTMIVKKEFTVGAKENPPTQPLVKTVPYTLHTVGKPEPEFIEVNIVQPYSADEIANIEKVLPTIPDIKKVDLQKDADKCVFKVATNKPASLLSGIKTLPGISRAEETEKDGHKTILITLGVKEKVQNNVPLSKKIMDALKSDL